MRSISKQNHMNFYIFKNVCRDSTKCPKKWAVWRHKREEWEVGKETHKRDGSIDFTRLIFSDTL